MGRGRATQMQRQNNWNPPLANQFGPKHSAAIMSQSQIIISLFYPEPKRVFDSRTTSCGKELETFLWVQDKNITHGKIYFH